jgi:hypothetical protein
MAQLTLTPLTPILRYDKYRSKIHIINLNDKNNACSFFFLSYVNWLNNISSALQRDVKNKLGQKTLVARDTVTLYQGDTVSFFR